MFVHDACIFNAESWYCFTCWCLMLVFMIAICFGFGVCWCSCLSGFALGQSYCLC